MPLNPHRLKTADILRISALLLRAVWSRTTCTLPAPYSQRLELLVSAPFFGWERADNKNYFAKIAQLRNAIAFRVKFQKKGEIKI